MKIAIIGKICSGKSYLANYLKDKHNFEILSFGEPVKKYAKEIFNLKFKNREIIQKFAQSVKEIDNDVWVKYLINNLDKHKHKHIVIDDLRFKNEQFALKKRGFIFIKLEIIEDFQIERIKKTYPDHYNVHINRLNDVSENNNILEYDYEFKITKESEGQLIKFIDTILFDIKK